MKFLPFFAVFILTVWVSASFALPAPPYLSVLQWKNCVNETVKGSAKFVCLPSKKPKSCPASSWQKLTKEHLIDYCPKPLHQ